MENLKNLIPEIKLDGDMVDCYPVDESQLISNAGDAEVYEYEGKRYEIIVWNERAEEHKEGEETISEIEL